MLIVGFSNHPNVMLVYKERKDHESHRIARVHHAIVDHYGLSTSSEDTQLPNERMMQAVHNQIFDTSAPTDW
jgi:hypothetical protein